MEEHPHFALLAYLAEVAAVRDPLPEQPETAEEEFRQGSIEDILTAAALAESMKEEIFIVQEDIDITMDERDDDVDITTFRGEETDNAMSEDQEPVAESNDEPNHSDVISTAKVHLESTTELVHGTVEPDDDALCEILTQSQNETDNMIETTCPIESRAAVEDDQDEWESLISYSEAEDNSIDHATTNDQSSASEHDILRVADIEEMHEDPVVPSPGDTIGMNEVGEFVAPQFNLFEDTSDSEQPAIKTRLSLDSTTTLSFPTEQNLITSPPKRQISALVQLDNVFPLSDPADSI